MSFHLQSVKLICFVFNSSSSPMFRIYHCDKIFKQKTWKNMELQHYLVVNYILPNDGKKRMSEEIFANLKPKLNSGGYFFQPRINVNVKIFYSWWRVASLIRRSMRLKKPAVANKIKQKKTKKATVSSLSRNIVHV